MGRTGFRQSFIEEVTPLRAVEKCGEFPDNFSFPAFCGSGVLFYGLDATGFQLMNFELNSRFIPKFGTTADDLNVYHKRVHSNHMLYDEKLGPTNQMPLGYMTFDLKVDGFPVRIDDLLQFAYDWERITDLKNGTVTTSYSTNRGLRIKVEHVLPMGSVNPHFRWSFQSNDGKAHKLVALFQLRLHTRHGLQLWDEAPGFLEADDGAGIAALEAATLKEGRFQAVSDYVLSWGLSMEGAVHRAENRFGFTSLSAQKSIEVAPDKPVSTEIRLHFGTNVSGMTSLEDVQKIMRMASQRGFDSVVMAQEEFWESFAERTACISTGDDVIDHLYNKSLRMLVSGMALDSGAPPSFQYVSGCYHWCNSTFHDSMHVARALLCTNAAPEASSFMGWLRDYCWQKEERPVYWLTRYDGLSITEGDEGDSAFMAMTIIGLIPVLYAEALAGNEPLAFGAYAMLRQLAQYTLKHLLRKEGQVYYLSQQTVTDVTPEALEAPVQQDGFVLLSLRPLLRKAYEYAARLGVDEAESEKWLDAAVNMHVPRDEEGFLLTGDGGDRSGWPFGWLPLACLSPDDPSISQAQIALWKAGARPGESGPPWGKFVGSAIGSMWGDGAFSEAQLRSGIRYGTYGPGYFAEFLLEGSYRDSSFCLANLPPFSTAHGAYVYAVAAHYLRDSVWDDRVEIGPVHGSSLAAGHWSAKRLRSFNGALISAEGDASGISGEITPSGERAITVELICPPALVGEELRLTYENKSSGKRVVIVKAGERPTFIAAEGKKTVFSLKSAQRHTD